MQHNGQISHVKNLGGIENPGHHEGSLCFGAVRVVHWLAGQAAGGDWQREPRNQLLPVVAGHIKLPSLGEAPEAQQGLEEVVGDDDAPQLERLPVLHQPLER